jgi:hypothetical protein
MRRATVVIAVFILLISPQGLFSQPTRVGYNNQQLFLSGGNLAWVSFSSDIGPGPVDYTEYANMLLQVHNSGGNAVRWWLHTDGRNTPQYNDTGLVVGPGVGTIANLKHALDLAWEREIGMNLCLWSFDMLQSSNSATVVNRNLKLLNDTAYIRAYINNCLIPMVDSLKGHPGILAWEIFNEPEGMTNYWHFYTGQYVSMAVIQRFVNLCAGAIHRTDPQATVTNGAWSFKSLSDIAPFPASLKPELAKSSLAEIQAMREEFNRRNRLSLTTDEFSQYLQRVADGPTSNYYRDDRLKAAGGDTLGILDFYEVHYYKWGGTSLSPFHNVAGVWGLSKPIVVAEFGITDFTTAYTSFSRQTLYDVLYQNNYAGALAWSWTDVGFTSHSDMLNAIHYMWDTHRTDVDVLGGAVDWPIVTIISPPNNGTYPDSTRMTIRTTVLDTLVVDSLEFFVADTLKIGSVLSADSVIADTSYYSFVWKAILAGEYTLKAVATNNHGHQGVSSLVQLSFGKPPLTRLQAETAIRQGDVSHIAVASSPNASGGAYLNVTTSDLNTTISWAFTNVAAAGSYYIAFGYRLEYQSPKTQFVNVNGVRVDTIVFDGTSTTAWYEKGISVYLPQGPDTVQIQLSWGWMDFDYLAVPTNVLTTVETPSQVPVSFSLLQNYPNPFNPTTTIKYSIPNSQHVILKLFDLLGRQIAVLVDQNQHAGFYNVAFDAGKLASGVYFYRIEAGLFVQTKKMLLLK